MKSWSYKDRERSLAEPAVAAVTMELGFSDWWFLPWCGKSFFLLPFSLWLYCSSNQLRQSCSHVQPTALYSAYQKKSKEVTHQEFAVQIFRYESAHQFTKPKHDGQYLLAAWLSKQKGVKSNKQSSHKNLHAIKYYSAISSRSILTGISHQNPSMTFFWVFPSYSLQQYYFQFFYKQ